MREVAHDEFVGPVPVPPLFIVRHGFSAGLDEEGQLLPAADRHRWSASGLVRGPPAGRTWEGSSRAADPRTVAWLRARSQDVWPDAVVDAVEVVWERRTISLRSGTAIDRSVVQRVRVELG